MYEVEIVAGALRYYGFCVECGDEVDERRTRRGETFVPELCYSCYSGSSKKRKNFRELYGEGRRDANEPAIITALQRAGFFVEKLSAIGNPGCPDLRVESGRPHPNIMEARKWLYVEVKTTKGRLSKVQREWHARWKRKSNIPILVVTDEAEAVEQVQQALSPPHIIEIRTKRDWQTMLDEYFPATPHIGLSMEEYTACIKRGERIIIDDWDMTDFLAG